MLVTSDPNVSFTLFVSVFSLKREMLEYVHSDSSI